MINNITYPQYSDNPDEFAFRGVLRERESTNYVTPVKAKGVNEIHRNMSSHMRRCLTS